MSQVTPRTWIKYRVYCLDEAGGPAWVERISGDGTTPAVCAHNNTHTVNTGSVQNIETISDKNVTILEESIPTGGHYRCETFKVTSLANSVNSTTISFPFPITIVRGSIQVEAAQRGDFVSVTFPNVTLGVLTADAAIADTVLHVTSDVTTNMKLGFDVVLTDGSTYVDKVGRVINIDPVAGTITIQPALTGAYTAASTVYVQATRAFIDNVELGGGPAKEEFNSGRQTGASLPSNTVGTLIYNNTHGTENSVVLVVQYLY